MLAAGSASYPVTGPKMAGRSRTRTIGGNAAVPQCDEALATAGDLEVVAIGLSGQMHGTVLLDQAMQPVRPAIIWEDRRSSAQVRSLTESIGAELD